ncbi:PadR family transcriptional regulator [Actinocorallia lasiicapitis]
MREQSYLILLALVAGPLYGYGIIAAVRELSDERVRLGPGTLYSALDRLSGEGLIALDHEEVVDGRFRRYYRLTPPGGDAVTAETERLTALAERARTRLAPRPQLGLS